MQKTKLKIRRNSDFQLCPYIIIGTVTYKVKALANNNTLSEFSQLLNITTPLYPLYKKESEIRFDFLTLLKILTFGYRVLPSRV